MNGLKREIIAMILAGGQGSRLKELTKANAKPAVEFGGKYRIIDFTLSNCTNSSIDVVGVLTQYQPFTLHCHIGIGTAWDLDRTKGGVYILPPHTNDSGGNWYKGTADAIYQNMNFVELFSPEYLLVLSGDHIYTMNYQEMLKFHKEKKADVTIACIEVPIQEASRFGIMNTREDNRIYEFEEKPRHPKNNLASMGIYIFNWEILKRYLKEDVKDENSDHDFGKNIIPKMLKGGEKLFAYPFRGYWKDVGTVESYWEANMDLLNESCPIDAPSCCSLDLYNDEFKVYTSSIAYPPQYIAPGANVKKSMIVEGCCIWGEVYHSVLSYNVYVGKNAKVINSVILSNSHIEEGAVVENAIICSEAKVSKGCIVRGKPAKIAVVPENKNQSSNLILE
ncbi:glucose-1-phosphate adenylyltransferase [Caldicellulosiruptor saccharolyticus DSM 8903]|uniref:Glucose-1-phosphate adenylyltransferase n=1 Tax=Caldicellulosiruptor saccharolyticus (strain ATCC 43494 / DSM 8903 / Tp8T 6331) TaxID=351627 RepID=A4XHL7_CALS8|nr:MULTISPECIES: glucose-1-phosphate adenylyltransferase [Caldicellulosiruptor]ABP66402.1 glucose-1-phosphate adenylyltransferase [Caldicellulosiruptor saccharolyticus DSM 8903]